MDYEKKYKEALERARICRKDLMNLDGVVARMAKDFFGEVFPELKESEDERIREEIVDYLKKFIPHHDCDLVAKSKQWIAWLEKQGEQKQHLELKAGHWYFCHQAYCCRADHLTVKEGERFMCEEDGVVKGFVIKNPEKYFTEVCAPAPIDDEQKPTDKVEPKFKVDDWIISPGGCYLHILDIKKDGYLCENILGEEIKVLCEHSNCDFKLWTIQDAKDGDVLVAEIGAEPNDFIYIFKEYNQNLGFWSHCYLDAHINKFHEGIYHNNLNVGVPATEEQRDLLFQKMHEAGYEWDAEKKELRKTEQKSAWSEEDEEMINAVIAAIRFTQKEHNHEVSQIVYEREIDWLKSIKDRVQL